MKFRVGPWTYRVRISSGPLNDEHGRLADGLICWSDREIWISESLPIEQRQDVLFHELAHAWEHHFGTPNSSEGIANRNSSFATDVTRQFDRQGGTWALCNLSSEGVVQDGVSEKEPSSAYAVQCHKCSGTIALGNVINSDPLFHRSYRQFVLYRSFYCEHCNITHAWIEGATPAGLPSGRVLNNSTVHGNQILKDGNILSPLFRTLKAGC